jgi:PAS domain S-box-containing protein
VDVFLAILGILLCALTGPVAKAQPNAKNVLVLFSSFGRNEDWLDLLEASIRARVPEQITFYHAFLEDSQVEEESYWVSQAETFRNRYAGCKLDLVVTVNPPALQFALRYRDKMLPETPIVFTRLSTKEVGEQKLWPGVTGVASTVGLRETIDLALQLHPDTTTVAVISGVLNWDRYWLAAAHSELLRRQDKVNEIDIVGPPSRQMLERVAKLPPHTVVLFQLLPQVSNQPAIGALDVLPFITQRLPTYSAWSDLVLNRGGVGGLYHDDAKDTSQLVGIVTRTLRGERPGDIPIVLNSDLQVRLDWRQLQRWHIPESALPQRSVILYRPPTVWMQFWTYRKDILLTILAIVALLLLAVGLLWHRARTQKAEAVLRESEQRFKVMADTTPALIWMCDAQGKVTYLNERRVAFTGPDPNGGYGDTWITYIHPDDQKNVSDAVSQALTTRQPFTKEYRLRRSDGVYRWMLDVATPRVNGDGSFAGFIGSAIDTTDQKLAQQALEKVSGQMIAAQEKERSRIARDLHDDICQRLALLSMEIEQTKRVSGDLPVPAKERFQEIRKHCSEIAGDVQSLSHQLHSSKLDYLGLESAIRGFCREFSKQHDVNVEFTATNVPEHLPKDISLCLFRVAQEGVQNALKYSGVNQFTVKILTREDEIHLAVADEGAGFDLEEAKRNQGLGLMSMQERVHLVHGVLSVESKPGGGTRILVVLPLDGQSLHDEEMNETARVTRMA